MAEDLGNELNKASEAYSKSLREQTKALTEMKKIQAQLVALSKDTKDNHDVEIKKLKQSLSILEKKSKEQAKQLQSSKKRLSHIQLIKKAEQTEYNSFKSFSKDYKNLTPEIQKQLSLDNTKAQLYNELGAAMARQEGISVRTGGIVKQNAEEKASIFKEVTDEMKTQAQMTSDTIDEIKGVGEYEKKIRLIKLNDKLSKQDKERAIAGLEYAEKLEKKTEILTELDEKRGEIFEEINPELSKSVKGAMGLANAFKNGGIALGAIGLAIAALTAAVTAFVELDKSAEDYRKTTGLTVKQTEHLNHQVHEIEVGYRKIGVELDHVYDVANALGNSFSNVAHFSEDTLAALSVVTARTGTTAENATKVQAVFEQVAGVSSETAASLQMQVASLAQQAGASPKEVLDDIAESAEITSKFFKGDVNLLKQQAIQANRLGTTLAGVAKTAEALLDFEGGIEEELVAATFVGGQFNLSRARALAMEGKLVQAQEETLSQIQRSGDFRKQDYFTQQQLAKAAGMSVEEINKQLNMQERLAHLGKEEKELAMQAVEAGLDVTDLSDAQLKNKIDEFAENQKITGQLTDMLNIFKQIGASVSSLLLPPLKAMADGLKFILDNTMAWVSVLGVAATIGYMMYQNSAKAAAAEAAKLAMQEANLILQNQVLAKQAAALGIETAITGQKGAGAVAGIMSSYAGIAFGLGIPLALIAIGAMTSNMNKAKHIGDGAFPASGGSAMISTQEGGIFQTSKNDDIAVGPGILQPNGSGNSNSLLNDKFDKLIAAVSANKDTYLDGSKVTSNLKRVSDKSNRNNFALA